MYSCQLTNVTESCKPWLRASDHIQITHVNQFPEF